MTVPGRKVTKVTRSARVPRSAPRGELRERALSAFRNSGTVASACDAVGISRQTWYRWAEEDPEFAKAMLEATQDVVDDLESEAIRRAKEGSDALLMFILRARRPEAFRDRHTVEVVSPEVRENIRQMINVINEELDLNTAERLLERLDKVWSPSTYE